MNSFVSSYYLSVLIQFATFFIQLYGYLLPVDSKLLPLKYALNTEFFVSIIELLVYLWIGFNLSNLSLVMKKRYMDWFITTNAMLIALSLLFIFYNQQEAKRQESEKQHTFKSLIKENKGKFIPILIFNTLMLITGYLGETKIISKIYSFTIGFVFFILSFYYLFDNFAKYSDNGKRVFYIIATIWSLYGIAHLLGKINKNTAYNILDLISKNVLGVFLVFLLYNYVY